MEGLKRSLSRRDDELSRVSWQDLEHLLAAHYRAQGYEVDHAGTGSSATRFDGGIDLKLRRPGEYVLVQCKHWNAYQLPHNAVHELIGIMVNEDASGAIMVNSGEYTRAARDAAARQPRMRLIDGKELREMLGALVPRQSMVRGHGLEAVRKRDHNELVDRFTKSLKRGRYDGIIEPLVRFAVGALALILLVQCGPSYFKSLLPAPSQPAPRVRSVELPQSVRPFRESVEREPQGPRAEPPPMSYRAMEDAALQEWRRRNAESMKILEETTPEL